MKKKLRLLDFVVALAVVFVAGCHAAKVTDTRTRVLFDTDANNELDDQHAMAYLFFNSHVFDVAGVTVNATYNGGDINQQYEEAKRVMQLCNVYGKMPLLKGANGSFTGISKSVGLEKFDGSEAVNFIIRKAHEQAGTKLVLLPVGKLTNIALALLKDPSIANKVRIVWLGSNYPDPGEYNQDNDTAALNYILNQDVPFEMVTVRYGKPSGTAAVTANRMEINRQMPGMGPEATVPVTGRHGGVFRNFGDYSVDLFRHIDTYDSLGTRALFDMAAVAVVKNPGWAQSRRIPAPMLSGNVWKDRPSNPRTILIWENFNRELIMDDFYKRMKQFVLPAGSSDPAGKL